MTDAALKWLNEREPGRFFLNLHYLDPHDPYDPPAPHNTAFAPDSYNIDPRSRKEIALYDGEILHVDEQFARILAELRRSGLERTTGIVIISDHGEEFREHGGTRHGFTMFEEQVHVPLITVFPGLTDDVREVSSQVRLLDVMPTVLDALGIEQPPVLEGRSLLPVIYRQTDDVPAALSEWGYTPLVAWRRPPWKLIHNTQDDRSFLFNLERDPLEQIDVAENERQLTERLLAEMRDERRRARELGETLSRDEGDVALSEEQLEQLKALGYIDTK